MVGKLSPNSLIPAHAGLNDHTLQMQSVAANIINITNIKKNYISLHLLNNSK